MNKAQILANTASKDELRSVIGEFNERNRLALGNKVVAVKKRKETTFYISKRKELLCALDDGRYVVLSDLSHLNKLCIDLGMNEDWVLEQYKAYINNRGLITAAPIIYDPLDIEASGQYVAGIQSFYEYGYSPVYLTRDVYDYLRKIDSYLDRRIRKNLKDPTINKSSIYKDYVEANQYSFPHMLNALNYDTEVDEELSSQFERRFRI